MDTARPIAADKGNGGGQNAPFGVVERKIARRYLGAKKSEGGVAVIAWISFTCIMLAIWAMITIMSIMNGFRAKVLELTLGSEGHMYVALWSADVPPQTVKDIENKLAALPEVDTAIEFSQNIAGFMENGRLMPGRVIGVSKENLLNFKLVSDNVQYGSLNGFGQGSGAAHQIIMGDMLAASMGLSAGDRVRMLTSRTRANAFGPPTPITKVYTVGAVFETGLIETDRTTVYMDLDQSQLLFSNGRKQGEIQIRLHDPDDIDHMIGKIKKSIGQPVVVETWKDRFIPQAVALRTEQIAMRFIFVIVVIIATFPVLSAMLMLVKNKGKDIAILRTIGATKGSIMRIFFIAGSMIGFIGTIMGLIAGILFCLNIDIVQGIIETITGQELFPPEVYGITGGIPVKIVWAEVAAVAACGFIISAIATFFPALAASKTDPVDALRYE